MAGKKTFVAGEVLTAQDVNDYLMDQSVMTFASSAARSSAIPTPTEGMTTYVSDRNQIETYNGTEYRGMSGLQLIKKQEIGSGVASVEVTGAFSATYDNYLIILSGGVGSTATGINLTLGATVTGYYRGGNFTSFGSTTVTGVASANASNWQSTGVATTTSLDARVELFDPFLAKNTKFRGSYASALTTGESLVQQGFLNNTTSYTDFTFTKASGTLTGGTIYVYGYGT
jgi:hypothetical protein